MKLNLKEKRERHGLSTADVASEIGVSVATVARCEREDRWPENAASRRAWQKLYEEDNTTEND
jgi:DNA-binding XRE family transcriptional regulator